MINLKGGLKMKRLSILFIVLVVFLGILGTRKGMIIYGQANECNLSIQNLFTPSGWMGDGVYGRKYLNFEGSYSTDPHSPPTCIRIQYTFGPQGWAGIYWQNRPDNWGDYPGENYSNRGFKKIVFWAKGTTGTEVIEFKAGCIDNPSKKYRDSFCVTTGRITLSTDWRRYEIDLGNVNLSSVIGGFCWVASKDYNQGKSIIFYIDDICFVK